MRIALVHDWLTGMRGGERCLEALCRLWPDAHLYTLLHRPGSVSAAIERMNIRTSFLQRVPGIFTTYRYFLPIMPIAIEQFRLVGYDLVVSLSHCVAKSVRLPPEVPHVCYCFTPMRYAWQQRAAYFGRCGESRRGEQNSATRLATLASAIRTSASCLSSPIRSMLLADLRRWDRSTSDRVSQFIAISRTVQQRIRECYGRESTVIYPPVDVEFFSPAPLPREDFYLCVSALVPYKQIDLAVRTCNQLRRRLVVIGAGPERRRLQTIGGPTVTFLGWQSDETIRDYYRRCRALLFPGEEDFGIVPLEAQACGAPVIAYAAGGAVETVIAATDSRQGTGLHFRHQSSAALAEAILQFEARPVRLSARMARCNAERFRAAQFTTQLEALVARWGRESPPAGIRQRSRAA